MKAIVQYIRRGHRKPVGCVVVLDEKHIGFSLVHPHDMKESGKFPAKRALYHFAKARAEREQVTSFINRDPKNSSIPENIAWGYLQGNAVKMVPHDVRRILFHRFLEFAEGEKT